jgi:hypothetical protein
MGRDHNQLEALLREAAHDDVSFNPMDGESFQARDGGSLVGLCVSYQWHDGVRVCRDAGLNPDRNAMVRDPLMWAYHNDDVVSLALLLEMGTDPARLSPDTRFWGVSRPEDVLTADRLTELTPTLGDLDVFYLQSHLAEKRPVELRPVFGRIALNDLRPNSHVFFERLAPLVVTSQSCRWFAQFAYFRAWSIGHEDVALGLLDALSLQPELAIVEDRMGLVDTKERFGVDMENPDRSAPWVMSAIKGGRNAVAH